MTCFHCRVHGCKICDGSCGLCGQLCPGYVKECDCDDCTCYGDKENACPNCLEVME